MNAVIDPGHLYIAQPPLFKVKKGKVEKYLMNEREFEEFFLTAWVEGAAVKVPGTRAPITGAPLLDLLREVSEYRALFGKIVRRGVPAPILAELLREKFRGNKRGVGHDEIGEAIVTAAAAVNGFHPEVRPAENGAEGHTVTIPGSPTFTFSTALFKSADYAALYDLWEKLAAAAKGPTALIDDAGKETPIKDLDALHRLALERSRAGASFQRYKGLGEMNPEQLWETTMNPETRTLLKVTQEDAVGADEMFTVLMGDAVEPRRAFIEKHALDVANLDI
jgi:DNA gyrase subunit B